MHQAGRRIRRLGIHPGGAMAAPERSPAPEDEVSRPRIAGYAVGSAGTGIFTTVPGLILLFYLTDVLGVAAALAGFLVVAPKVWDVFFNPYVGALSDRQATRTGRRTGLMVIGGVSLPVAFALVFAGVGEGGSAAWWVGLTFLLAATCYALFQVPYVALPAEMSEDTAQRSRITGWRIIALTVGILLGGALAPVIVDATGGGVVGYRAMGVVIGALMMVAMLTAALTTRWVVSRPGDQQLGFRDAIRLGRGNRAYAVLLTAFVLQALGIAVALASIAYICTYFLGDYALTSLVFVAFVAPSAVVVPLWVKAGNTFGKWRVMLGNAAAFVGLFALFGTAVWLESTPMVLLAATGLGACYGGSQVLPLAMLTDAIIADEHRTSQRQAGAFTGVWTAAETGAFALGPGVLALFLAVSGFQSSTFEEPVTQSTGALLGIVLAAGLLPAVVFLASIPFVAAFGATDAGRIGDRRSAA
jgi:GPH family glycoside/pentoside/hexuronide:cation symporter